MKISRGEYSIKIPFEYNMGVEEVARYKKWLMSSDYANDMMLIEVDWDKKSLDDLFNGPYVCCAAELSGKRRVKDNFVAMHSLIVDFDNKEAGGGSATVKSIISKLGNLRYYINNSVSSSSVHQKLHLVIPCNRGVLKSELDSVRTWIRMTFAGLIPDESVIIEDCKAIIHGRADLGSWIGGDEDFDVDVVVQEMRLKAIKEVVNEVEVNKETKKKKITLVAQDLCLADDSIVTLEEAVERFKKTKKVVRSYCPVCGKNEMGTRNGKNDNAFLGVTKRGVPYVHCSSENETYWFKPEHIFKFLLDHFYFKGTQLYELIMEDGIWQDCPRTTDMLPFDNAGQRELARRYIAEKQTIINLKEFRKSNPLAVESYCEWHGNYRDLIVPVCVDDSVQDNGAVEDYLKMLFGPDVEFIREYITCLMYHNGSPKLPAVFLLGWRRTGKTKFGQTLARLLGEHLATYSDTVGGRFNAQLEKKFLLMNEAKEGDRVDAKDISNLLKNITGDEMLTIEKKGVDKINVINNCNLMYTTNRRRVLYLPEGDVIRDTRINPYYMRMFEPSDQISGNADRIEIARRGSAALAHWVKTVGWTLWNDKLRDQCKVGSGWDYCIDTPINEALLLQEGMSVGSRQRYAIEFLLHQIEYESIKLGVEAYMDFGKRDLRERIREYHHISSSEALGAINWLLEHPNIIKTVKPRDTAIWRIMVDEVIKYE